MINNFAIFGFIRNPHSMKTNTLYSFKTVFFLLVVLCAFSCSSDDDDENDTTTDPTGTVNPTDTNNPEREAAIKLYKDYYLASKMTGDQSHWDGNVADCNEGTASEIVRQKIIQRLHYFRKAVGLNNEITENPEHSKLAMKAALMMSANNDLNHEPPKDWKCYSEDGKTGASRSLLSTAENSESIDSYMEDSGSNNGAVGHRRWLYLPKLITIGIGNTDSHNAIHVADNSGEALPTNAPEFVSWPPKGYIPSQFAYPRWSFSLAQADFSKTKVKMTFEDGSSIPLSILPLKTGFGDPTIVWEPKGIKTKVLKDEKYTITLDNILLDNTIKSFTYEVTLLDVSKLK